MAAIADRELTQAGRRLQVCSWHLPEFPDADEGEWIRVAAESLSEPIDLFDGSGLLPFSRTDDRTICPDLPAYNGFRLLVNECYRRAAGHGCRVILNGNAGDQIYPPIGLLNIDRLRRRRWRPVWNDLLASWRAGGIGMILSNPAFRHPLGRIVRPFRRRSHAPDWMTIDAMREYQAVATWPPELEKSPFPDYAWQLVGSRMAFGRAHESEIPNRFGVDRRDPFHDEALLRFMLNAPFGLSHHKGWDKWIMRQATRGLIPDSLRRKRRTGLLHAFFRAGLRANRMTISALLFEQETDWQRFVRPQLIQSILSRDDHPRESLVCQCIGHALWSRYWNGEME
jgi:asparagine synthase (glutamine-hydrolysing)